AAAAARLLVVARASLEAADAGGELASALRASGNSRDVDLTREQLFVEDAALDVEEAEAQVAATREALNVVLGLHADELTCTREPSACARASGRCASASRPRASTSTTRWR